MNRDTLHTLAGCGIALAVGAIVGSLPIADRTLPITNGKLPAVDVAPARTYDAAFTESIRTATGAERWLTLLSATGQAAAADMPGLIRIAKNDPAMIRMLAARWVALDPHHMFSVLYADALLPIGVERLPGSALLRDVLLEEWPKMDYARAIAALNDAPDFPSRNSFRSKLADSAFKMDVERGLKLMGEWNVASIPDPAKFAAWAARDPRHAAEVVLSLSASRAGPEMLKQLGKTWAERDPAEGLGFAAGLAPRARASLGGEIIARWAERDLAVALAYAEAQPDAMRAALAQGLADVWAKSDPASALAWSQQNLKGGTRNEVIGKLVTTLAEKDLAAAGDLVAGMEPGVAQSRGTAAVFEAWFKKGGSEREAAFAWLAAVPDEEARHTALQRVGWNWAIGEPAAARDFLAGSHGDMAPASMIRMVVSIQAQANPEETMQWAGGLPADRREAARNAALEGWLESRPEGATAFTRALPAGPERTRAIETVSETLAYQSAELAAKWYANLSVAEKVAARESFNHANLPDEKRRELNKALEK